jgi:hypothetical protein
MSRSKRNLLVMVKKSSSNDHALEYELEQLHRILMTIEDFERIAKVYEVIDLNRFKVIRKTGRVKKSLLRRDPKHFEFLIPLN